LGVTIDESTGIAFVADSHPSTTGRTTDGRVWAVDPAGTKQIVIDGLPNGRHNTNGMAIKDGRLYITNGNSTDDGVAGGEPEVPPYSGSLLSVPVDGRNLGPGDAIVEATGMRNVYDVAFRPGTSEAWTTMNGPDALEPFGEDLLMKTDVAGPETDFGFPECIYRAGPGGPTDPEAGDNPVVPGTCGAHDAPEVTMGLHVSADGLAFGPEGSPWDGDLFVAEFGNFFGAPAGRKIVRVPIDAAGVAGAPVDVFVGGGPLDVAFGPGGNLYIADFAASQILLLPPGIAELLAN
jgi:glucose/arabinose dehydrogenase